MSFRLSVLPLTFAFLVTAPAYAGSLIEVMHPAARPTIPNRPGVTYLGVHNLGDTPDRLIAARAAGVRSIEIHKAEQKDDVMTMAPVDGVDVPAGGMVHFGPGGLHLMLFGIDPPLKDGESLEMVLIFQNAGEVTVTVPVNRNAGKDEHHGADDGGDHGTGHTMQHKHGTTKN